MMKIYIDLVLIVNFILDLILLMSVNFILRRNVSMKRLVLGSFIGNITLILLFIKMSNLLFIIFKLVTSILINVCAFGYKDFRYTTKNITYFYLVSVLLGGGIYFLKNQFAYSNKGLIFMEQDIGWCYGIVFSLGIFMFFKYVKSFKELDSHYSNYYNCKIYFDEENILEVNAFLDTGNKLKDPYSNKSIILVQEEMIDKSKDYTMLYVPYHSLNSRGLLMCYKAWKIEIGGKYCDKFLVGLSKDNFFIDGINCIINNKIMEGLK